MSDWQPIDTAPKDETHLLLWNGEVIRLGQYVPYGEHWAACDGFGWIRPQPTLWQPLPEPPAARKRRRRGDA